MENQFVYALVSSTNGEYLTAHPQQQVCSILGLVEPIEHDEVRLDGRDGRAWLSSTAFPPPPGSWYVSVFIPPLICLTSSFGQPPTS